LQGVIKITFNFKFWEESSFKISSSSWQSCFIPF
jgi:hypothetical protein